jgi:putative PIN family toxin of toxin-antitoxin system
VIAVIDTSVFVAGVFWRHEPHRVLLAWLRGVLIPVLSDPVSSEYERVLYEVKERERFLTDVDPWLKSLRASALWVTPQSLSEGVCRDPSDDKFIEAALAASAEMIIARDADLTVLEKPFGIQVMTPRAWLARLPRSTRRLIG